MKNLVWWILGIFLVCSSGAHGNSDEALALHPVLDNDKLGFIDSEGRLQVEPAYLAETEKIRMPVSASHSLTFSELSASSYYSDGLARVLIPRVWFVFTTGYDLGYIDRQGQLVFQADYEWVGDFSEGLAAFEATVGEKTIEKRNFFGYLDREGAVVVGPKFEWCGRFVEGLALAREGELFGYLHRNFGPDAQRSRQVSFESVAPLNPTVWKIAPRFRVAYNFAGDLAPASEDGRRFGYIDRSGAWVIEPRFDHAFPFTEGLARVMVDSLYGYIDRSGELVIPNRYRNAGQFAEGLARVGINAGFGFIDREGRVVIDPIYADAGSFSEGLAPVRLDYEWGFVNTKGLLVISTRFSHAHKFRNGIAQVRDGKDLGYINTYGDFVWDPTR